MTRGLTLSVVLHLTLIVLAVFGLPELARDREIEDRLVVVDVVTVGAVTNEPPPSQPTEKPVTPPQPDKAEPEAPSKPSPPPAAAVPPPSPPHAAPPQDEPTTVQPPPAAPTPTPFP